MSEFKMTRRKALGIGSALLAGCSLSDPGRAPTPVREMIVGRIWQPTRLQPPGDELVNSLEYEEEARRVLPEEIYAGIAGTNVEPFNRITFMPKANIPTLDMDLTVPLFGESLFAPLIVGPIGDLGAYRAEGDLAMQRGAAGANTIAIVSARTSVPLERIAREMAGPLWFGVYADDGARGQAREAAALGARALFITVGASYLSPGTPVASRRREKIDWRRLDSIREGLTIPIVLKGILAPEDALRAVESGYHGIVVSDHGLDGRAGGPPPLDALGPIAEVVDGRIPVLADGSFRRGSDVLKGLVLGADAILLNRPIVWALAAYGAEGVQWVLEKMQTEVARYFAMLGASTPDRLVRDHIRIHSAATA